MGPFATFAIVAMYFDEILAVVLIAVFAAMVLRYCEYRGRMKELRVVNEAAVALEADHQNMLFVQGDPVGTYGKFDAYTMPITQPYYQDDPVYDLCWPNKLDDYDDGMRNWR